MRFVDSFEEWPRTTPGRSTAVGLSAGALGGAVVGALYLLGDEGFFLAGALFYGSVVGCFIGVIAGGLAGAVAGGLASLLTRAGRRPARVGLALFAAGFMGLTAWLVSPPASGADEIAMIVGTVVVAAVLAWVTAPWCLSPRTATSTPRSH